ncbi:MAG: 5-carboxymethylaminomethyluridine-tRNA synthase GTPase subunit [Candidatus Westeberhardia cardiocondylae]|nr:5-carboxymethylaminomethyluridine-tRNA synthase GTPase subunit [Candidatus Westeberhardia cardiocondylae]
MKDIMDTIAAISTPPGYGGIGVIRVSGPLVISIVIPVILGKILEPRKAEYLLFKDKHGEILDKGIALFFPSPNSFTGEDVLELQGHGSPVVLDEILKNIISFSGIRIAKPGEFSERAFLNKKLDLVQAESIIDLIYSESIQFARLAIRSVQGVFSSNICDLVQELLEIRTCLEGKINFPSENITECFKNDIKFRLENILDNFNKLFIKAKKGNVFQEGIKIVISGEPNVGKSSLLNLLTNNETAIVTSIAGTTRDVLRSRIDINGIPCSLIDTAGLCDDIDNEIDRISIQRSFYEILNSDIILFVVDSRVIKLSELDISKIKFFFHIPKNIPVIIVRNKSDLTGELPEIHNKFNNFFVTVSAKLNHGISLIEKLLKNIVLDHFGNFVSGKFLVRRRHLDALHSSKKHIIRCKKYLKNGYFDEVISEELYLAQKSLSEITGQYSSDDLIRKIFSNFCIGK